MTDRELLELAAKAAGIELCWFEIGEDDPDCAAGWYCSNVTNGGIWNPLTDDGDALRLAVAVRLFHEDDVMFALMDSTSMKRDPYAATRRAITRAAAEIGRAMK